jgi:hypothetical protein
LQTLEELGLITISAKGIVSAVKGAPKTALNNAPLYKDLLERSGNCEK